MNTKLSLLSRAAVIAGVVALSLPAFAQTTPPAAPSAAPAAAPATSSTAVDHKADKSTKKHVAKKPLLKTAKNSTAPKAAAPVTSKVEQPSTKMEQPSTTGGSK